MSAFLQAIRDASLRSASGRSWIYVPYDQLDAGIGPLATLSPHEAGIVMLENPRKAARRPYHKQKLAMVLANGRQFLCEQARRGVAVRFRVVGDEGYAGALSTLVQELGPITMMEPAERELRQELAPLVDAEALRVVPHAGWLSAEADFATACPEPPYRMDVFYRFMRKKTGLLMERGKPLGGKWSHDADNRKAWKGTPAAPAFPTFEPDAITREVLTLVEQRYARHPGTLDGASLPATHDDAERLWAWAKNECLPWFGPFEDAMSSRSSSLFHTRLSALLNLGRLSAARILEEAVALPLSIASQEGFVRQLLGWREFMRHVHTLTDGFRSVPGMRVPVGEGPGDGGYARWAGEPWEGAGQGDPGAEPALLGAQNGLPAAYWGERSGFRCLDSVVGQVWRDGYSHHITRLMVLSNLAMLLDVSPRELTDWFWVAYVDAYDWVVEPNVLAMGSFGVGDLMTTKPYIAGSAYIDRMSDFCRPCAFDPKTTCPFTPMYWAYLARHEQALSRVARMDMPLRSLSKRAAELRARDRRVYEEVLRALLAREELTPEGLSGAVD